MNDLLIVVGVPLIRAGAGWLENALADGTITLPEWKKLVNTVLRLGIPSTLLFYGLNMPVGIAVSIPVLVDYGFNWIKKLIEKVKKMKKK